MCSAYKRGMEKGGGDSPLWPYVDETLQTNVRIESVYPRLVHICCNKRQIQALALNQP